MKSQLLECLCVSNSIITKQINCNGNAQIDFIRIALVHEHLSHAHIEMHVRGSQKSKVKIGANKTQNEFKVLVVQTQNVKTENAK